MFCLNKARMICLADVIRKSQPSMHVLLHEILPDILLLCLLLIALASQNGTKSWIEYELKYYLH